MPFRFEFLFTKDLKKFLLPLPSLEQQEGISSDLDNITAEAQSLRAIYLKKLDDLAELKQAILQKAFSGELTAQPDQALKEAVA